MSENPNIEKSDRSESNSTILVEMIRNEDNGGVVNASVFPFQYQF